MADPLDNQTSGEQLRRLLLQEEQDRLDRLEARLGDDENLKNSLVPLIADVLRDAGVQDYRRLAGALAPIVLQSIKTEIHNSRDMMVDALYPITGRLVAAAVRNAFKDLVDQLNQKLDSSLSVDRWRARFKAKMTGRSEAEILLSEGAAFEITNLLLINRETGFLMAQAGSDAEQGGMDSQMLGSILTAIMAFVRDAMRESPEQDLRTLDVGDMRLHLQMSPGAILAIKTKGPPPARFDSALNETFCAFLAHWGETLSDPDEIDSAKEVALSSDLEDRFQALLQAKQSNFRAPSRKGAILLGGLALIAIGLIGWHLYGRWERENVLSAARAVIDAQPQLAGYPLTVRYRSGEEAVGVAGLTPDQAALDHLIIRLTEALPDTKLLFDVQPLPRQNIDLGHLATQDDLTRSTMTLEGRLVSALDQKTAALGLDLAAVDQKTANMRRDLAAMDEQAAAIDRRTDGLRSAIERVEMVLPGDDERKISAFRTWIERQSLRFGEGNSFQSETQASNLLREISSRLIDLPADVSLLIVGYADDSGVPQLNEQVSLERADIVSRRLQRLGVPSTRLTSVGRSSENRISQEVGTRSANRRVELELIFRQPDAGLGSPVIDGGNVER